MMSVQGALLVARVHQDEIIRRFEDARLARCTRAGSKVWRRRAPLLGRRSLMRLRRS